MPPPAAVGTIIVTVFPAKEAGAEVGAGCDVGVDLGAVVGCDVGLGVGFSIGDDVGVGVEVLLGAQATTTNKTRHITLDKRNIFVFVISSPSKE